MKVITLSLIALAVTAGYVRSVEAEPFVNDQADVKSNYVLQRGNADEALGDHNEFRLIVDCPT